MGKPLHLAVGNINIDVYLRVERLPGPDEELPVYEAWIGPGGAASNYAVAVARAGHQVKLLAHTTLHAKGLGVLDALASEGVDLNLVRIHKNGIPGIVIVVVTHGGETAMFKVRGVNALLRGDEVEGEFDVIHAASCEPAVVERLLTRTSARIYSYDPGGAIALKQPHAVRNLVNKVTILTLNRPEFRDVFGNLDEALKLMKDDGILVVRLGALGALAITSSGDAVYVRSCRLGEPVDTTGAGDVFNAYMNVWLVEGKKLEEALEAGAVAAGIKVLRRGAQSAPYRHEVEDVLRGACRGLSERLDYHETRRLLEKVS